MKNEFVPYDPALALKELGFDEPVFNAFCTNTKELIVEEGEDMVYGKVIPNDDTISAPLYQQVFRWFREKYGVEHTIARSGEVFMCTIDFLSWNKMSISYEEGELACLRKLIEIVKNKYNEKNI